MSPKTINDLDPKLKETYERVMGTSLNTPSAAEQPIQKPVMQQTEAIAPDLVPPQTIFQQAQSPIPEMVASPQMPSMTSSFQQTAVVPTEAAMKATVTKKKSSLIPILLAVGIIIFFVCYGVIWAKVFGLF
jgi:hypothetical protein